MKSQEENNIASNFDITKINLDAYEIEPFANSEYTGISIKWDSDIGFGEYTIYKSIDSDEWCAHSECMDINEDKSFITELMRLFIEKIIIKG